MDYSFIICAKNEEENINELLFSIDNLNVPKAVRFEVILVDDGSSDRTVQLASQAKIEGLRIIRTNGRGAAAARNKGTRAASGRIIVFADCDGFLDKDCLSEIHKLIVSDVMTDIVQGNIWMQYYSSWANNYLMKWRESIFKKQMVNSDGTLNCFHTRLVAIRKSFFRKISTNSRFFNEHLPGAGGEDLECGRRAFRAGAKIILAEKAIIYHKDPTSFMSLVLKRYKNGMADSRAGVGQKFLDFDNFYSVVIYPQRKGVPIWFSFSFWLAYVIGCLRG